MGSDPSPETHELEWSVGEEIKRDSKTAHRVNSLMRRPDKYLATPVPSGGFQKEAGNQQKIGLGKV